MSVTDRSSQLPLPWDAPREYGFGERLGFSRGVSAGGGITDILMANIPGATDVTSAITQDDRNGTDHWVERSGLSDLSIDLKARESDPMTFRPPQDDLALETFSDVARETPGWTRDASKRTDYILWYFTPTGRWVLVPFPMLCAIFTDKWRAWRDKYQTATQQTNCETDRGGTRTWKSECVFVPRLSVWRAMYERYGGNHAH